MTAEPAMKGVFFDHPDLVPEDRRRSRACLSVADTVAIEGPLVETVLRGGVYARLAYTGPYADMRWAYSWLMGLAAFVGISA